MKRTLVVTLILITMLSLSACGKDTDTGVIVSAVDSGRDTAANERLTADSGVVAPNENTNATQKDETTNADEADNTTISRETTTISSNPDKVIYGTWIGSGGTIYEFSIDGRFSGYDTQVGSGVNGSFETDSKTYINLTYDGEYEQVEVTDEKTGETWMDSIPKEPETKNCTIKSFEIDGDSVTIVIVKDGTEITLVRDPSLPSNSASKLQENIDELNNKQEESEGEGSEEVIDPTVGRVMTDEEVQQFLNENASAVAQPSEDVVEQPAEAPTENSEGAE